MGNVDSRLYPNGNAGDAIEAVIRDDGTVHFIVFNAPSEANPSGSTATGSLGAAVLEQLAELARKAKSP